VHIAFGHRFIVTERQLLKRHIPAELYAEVILGLAWKDSLSVNKSSLACDHERLLLAIERKLTPLIDELEAEAQEIEIRGFVFELAHDAQDLIAALDDEPGTHGEGPLRTAKRGAWQGVVPGARNEEQRGELPTVGDKGAHREVPEAAHKKKMGVEVNLANIGPRVTKVSIAATGVRVTLNKDLLYVRLVKQDKPGLLVTIFNALLDECVVDEARAALVFPKFKRYREEGEGVLDAKQHVMHDALQAQEASIH
jgi:hypothetical protein